MQHILFRYLIYFEVYVDTILRLVYISLSGYLLEGGNKQLRKETNHYIDADTTF